MFDTIFKKSQKTVKMLYNWVNGFARQGRNITKIHWKLILKEIPVRETSVDVQYVESESSLEVTIKRRQ